MTLSRSNSVRDLTSRSWNATLKRNGKGYLLSKTLSVKIWWAKKEGLRSPDFLKVVIEEESLQALKIKAEYSFVPTFFCWYCGLPLTTPESKRIGIGKDCASKVDLSSSIFKGWIPKSVISKKNFEFQKQKPTVIISEVADNSIVIIGDNKDILKKIATEFMTSGQTDSRITVLGSSLKAVKDFLSKQDVIVQVEKAKTIRLTAEMDNPINDNDVIIEDYRVKVVPWNHQKRAIAFACKVLQINVTGKGK